jgi:hypothetical protein
VLGRAKTRYFLILILVTVFSITPHSVVSQNKDKDCNEPLPKGFKSLGEVSWNGPWVFEKFPGGWKALSEVDNSRGYLKHNPIKVRLDDDTWGTLNVEKRDCQLGDDCSPYDCGCFKYDSYWIHIRNAEGKGISDYHLWAAYGGFEIIPIDLVDGPGDELIIIRIPNRGSPSVGRQLRIWKIGGKKPIELMSDMDFLVASWLNGCCCSIWRDTLYIAEGSKPPSLILKKTIGANACCTYVGGEGVFKDWGSLKIEWRQILSYSQTMGKYIKR